ncbi:hypothetical protein WALSEDRAFT_70867 [Wallemia mellicola CBS 633.66]|uniref:Uncharacterized protein n=1 Tax=Wallemia mellicola (strain ATCC MYA-4683 / CBS 633.66) TaxID=671144 RepID=I4Y580_WALMC|nr:hypothetical protein WALSEDRAFT_70867 [Wallemia mellicola CBS 633.66]EIM19122.1 hypothetical protein WALSEDRAFT_70867 [Wallemia mellicola CBS 633.66]|eukprot:XP_006960849.1 hypothetical protein WALSEDRAFT_70867 [Wallemia mellicola CBS 633.66]
MLVLKLQDIYSGILVIALLTLAQITYASHVTSSNGLSSPPKANVGDTYSSFGSEATNGFSDKKCGQITQYTYQATPAPANTVTFRYGMYGRTLEESAQAFNGYQNFMNGDVPNDLYAIVTLGSDSLQSPISRIWAVRLG